MATSNGNQAGQQPQASNGNMAYRTAVPATQSPRISFFPVDESNELYDIFGDYIRESDDLYDVAAAHVSQLRDEAASRDDDTLSPTPRTYGQYITETMTEASLAQNHNSCISDPSVLLPVPYKQYREALLNHPAAAPSPRAFADKLEIVNPRDFVREECIICFGRYEYIDADDDNDDEQVEEHVVRLPCQHVFHLACIRPLLTNDLKCPRCREVVPAYRRPLNARERFELMLEALSIDEDGVLTWNALPPEEWSG